MDVDHSPRVMAERNLRRALVAGLVVAAVLSAYLFVVRAWVPAVLTLVWLPLMVFDYRVLRSARPTALAVAIFASFGMMLVTTMAAFLFAGVTPGTVVGVVALVLFAVTLAAGAIFFERAAMSEDPELDT